MSFRMLFVVRTITLLGITVTVQYFHLPLAIYLLFIHTMLFLTTLLMGGISAAVIGMVNPWVAFYSSNVPIENSAVIPFIIMGNLALVAVFRYFDQKGFTSSFQIIIASIVSILIKYIFIAALLKMKPDLSIQALNQLSYLVIALYGFLAAIIAIGTNQILARFGIQELKDIHFTSY